MERQQWEYLKINENIRSERLNQLGQEYWELVNVYYNSISCEHTYIFKRPADRKIQSPSSYPGRGY